MKYDSNNKQDKQIKGIFGFYNIVIYIIIIMVIIMLLWITIPSINSLFIITIILAIILLFLLKKFVMAIVLKYYQEIELDEDMIHICGFSRYGKIFYLDCYYYQISNFYTINSVFRSLVIESDSKKITIDLPKNVSDIINWYNKYRPLSEKSNLKFVTSVEELKIKTNDKKNEMKIDKKKIANHNLCNNDTNYNLPSFDIIKEEHDKELLKNYYNVCNNSKSLNILIGNENSNLITIDFYQIPNLLVGGSIMSGRTNFVESILVSLLFSKTPKDLKLIIYDSKNIEYADYNGLPHLLFPVIKNLATLKKALSKITYYIDQRIEILSNNSCKKVLDYNNIAIEKSTKLMPDILIVIDLMSDLEYSEEIEKNLKYILENGYRVNIFIIMVANYPIGKISNIVTKENFPSRISFRVPDRNISKSILDIYGAEKLNNIGDGINKNNINEMATYFKSYVISENTKKEIINFCINQQKVNYNEKIIQDENDDNYEELRDEKEEPLYDEIVDYVIETGLVSTSLLQRKFKIGYNRAARCIDLLEEKGIVGPSNGDKPRDVLVRIKSNYDER